MTLPLDLKRHAVIEASAGTGKTFTIEQIVLRLLQEEQVPLENILLVTFTEKATGELRSRLRLALERALYASDEPAPLVQAGLDQFDQAPIFTIHGFCQRLLQEYSLEKGEDFRPELIDDKEWLETALQEIQRGDWVRTFGDRLASLLDLARYNRTTAEQWHRRALDLAKVFRPACGHLLIPEESADFHLDARVKRPAGWEHQLLVHTVRAMQAHLDDHKRQRGLQSYDDMIARVEQGLSAANPRADVLLDRLRERFRYAIVDEFQDTDPLQWRIFRTLFLEGGTSKLMIVGDPKQAIYSFRGADLPTYLQAAQTMTRDFGAASQPLQVNWRSSPGLLEALNRLFETGKFFDGTGIQYVRVQPPEESQRTTGIVRDDSGRTDLTLVDLRSDEKSSSAQRHYAGFVSREIRRLLYGNKGKPTLEIQLKNQPPRPIDAGDICILVFSRREAEPLTHAFAQDHIPYSFYREGGLWTSPEAEQIGIVLRALQSPEEPGSFNKALLTQFFRVRPVDLAQAGDLPTQHPARRLFQAWAEFAEERQWAALFQSLLEHTGIPFEGYGEARFDRRQANYRNLLEALERKAYGDNLNLLGLLEFFERKKTGFEGDAQPMDTELPKVKFMTIHSSKGLEFPVVFLAGGFTQGKQDSIATYRDDAGRLIFDLEISGKNKDKLLGEERKRNERAVAERASERRRLLYVAMTRAMFKLYVPLMGAIKHYTKGPLVTLLAPAVNLAGFDSAYIARPDERAPDERAFIPNDAEPKPRGPVGPPIKLPQLFLPIDEHLGQRRIVVRSFTSLHRSRTIEPSAFGDRPLRLDEIQPPTLEIDDPLRGAVFGDLVHNVLEKIDWPLVGQARDGRALQKPGSSTRKVLDDEIAPNLAKFPTRLPLDVLETSCRELVADLVWKALHTPLPFVGPLWELPAKDRLQELEFLFPQAEDASDRRREEGFFTGYMDLVFRVKGKYYILDWKTNLLPDYGPEELAHSMAEADYHRQYRLYWQALVRWLSRMLGKDFEFSRHVGGAFYLYVRGLTGVGGSPGVFFHQPTPAEITLKEILER